MSFTRFSPMTLLAVGEEPNSVAAACETRVLQPGVVPAPVVCVIESLLPVAVAFAHEGHVRV